VDRWRAVAHRLGVADEPVFADTHARLQMDLADLGALYEVYVDQVRRGNPLGPDVSMLKIFASELYQRITDTALALAGAHGA
jgi:alkylation response protein AidB-like acyl-CoA dehydrogenase